MSLLEQDGENEIISLFLEIDNLSNVTTNVNLNFSRGKIDLRETTFSNFIFLVVIMVTFYLRSIRKIFNPNLKRQLTMHNFSSVSLAPTCHTYYESISNFQRFVNIMCLYINGSNMLCYSK